MYDDVSKIIDEHGAETITMKIMRNRLEDLYERELTSEGFALLEQMIKKKFDDPETQRVLATRTPQRTPATEVNAGGSSSAVEVQSEGTGMAEEPGAPVAQQVRPQVATAAPVPDPNLERYSFLFLLVLCVYLKNNIQRGDVMGRIKVTNPHVKCELIL